MAKPSSRDKILDAGLRVMLRQGYAAGVREIVAEAGVPQGSFTNHFRSKEAFAEAVLERYFGHVKELVKAALDEKGLSPRDRLRRYLDIITGRLVADGCARGCLIGDFSVEASPSSELVRERLAGIFIEWRTPFATCIAEAQAAGEIDAVVSPDELADFFLASWQGAILRMKVERSAAPLERFQKVVFATVFKHLESGK